MPTPYVSYRDYSVHYDITAHTFSFSHARFGCFLRNGRVLGTRSADPRKNGITPADYKDVSFSHSFGMSSSTLTVTYTGGPTLHETLNLLFTVSRDGIRYEAHFWGDTDSRAGGDLFWGADMENSTFATCLERPGGDLRAGLGPACSAVDNALFDRESDSLLEFSNYGNLRLKYDWRIGAYSFESGTGANDCMRGFTVRIRENLFATRLGVNYAAINKKSVFPTPPCGWMSWYAAQFETDEDVVLENARWLAENLKSFGAGAIWVDWEWYHSSFGGVGPEGVTSLSPDKTRYPNGMRRVADEITKLGLIPAIWIGPTNEPVGNDEMEKHPDMVMARKPEWCGQYFFDITNNAYLNEYVPKVFGNLKKWGFRAIKWDCVPITLEYADMYHGGMEDGGLTSEQAFRNLVATARRLMGSDVYMLSCAGNSERDILCAADMFDAARVGGDMFKWEEFVSQGVERVMKFYQVHNIMLRNDPDNLILREEYNTFDRAVSRVTFVSLLGLPVTMGDHLPSLPPERVELLKRVLPALDCHPVDIRETRAGEKVLRLNLAVERPFESWNVAGLINLTDEPLDADLDFRRDLCVDDGEYLVYDFWNRRFLGVNSTKVSVALRPNACAALGVRRKSGVPQVLTTSRHISQGAAELSNVKWDAERSVLSGVSGVIKGDLYEIVIYVPEGWAFVEGSGQFGWRAEEHGGGSVITGRILPNETREVEWCVKAMKNE